MTLKKSIHDAFFDAILLRIYVCYIQDLCIYPDALQTHSGYREPHFWELTRVRQRSPELATALCSDFQRFINERRARPGERNDLLSLLLQARDESGQPMSNEQLMTECQSLFAAGYETMVT